jgi:hypothetical protein
MDSLFEQKFDHEHDEQWGNSNSLNYLIHVILLHIIHSPIDCLHAVHNVKLIVLSFNFSNFSNVFILTQISH